MRSNYLLFENSTMLKTRFPQKYTLRPALLPTQKSIHARRLFLNILQTLTFSVCQNVSNKLHVCSLVVILYKIKPH